MINEAEDHIAELEAQVRYLSGDEQIEQLGEVMSDGLPGSN